MEDEGEVEDEDEGDEDEYGKIYVVSLEVERQRGVDKGEDVVALWGVGTVEGRTQKGAERRESVMTV